MLVKEIMSKKVITVKPGMSVHEAAELFIAKGISAAPVVDKSGKLLGIIQERGVIFQDKKAHLPTVVAIAMGFITLGVKRFEDELKKITASKVLDILEKDFLTVSPEATVEDAATLMIEKDSYYCLAMEDGRIAGIVTKRDIIRAIAHA
ncbi:MAG: CBS domain-containing protein [Candidatus Omnitrophota bacterium]